MKTITMEYEEYKNDIFKSYKRGQSSARTDVYDILKYSLDEKCINIQKARNLVLEFCEEDSTSSERLFKLLEL